MKRGDVSGELKSAGEGVGEEIGMVKL